jgi:selenocysteine-specific elongation factor
MSQLLSHLSSEAGAFTRRAAQGMFRLAVDRCFTLAGAGTVVTGTVFAGKTGVGDELIVSPSGKRVRVRSIHAQNRAARDAGAGDRCALNLAGVAKDEVERGEWIVTPELHAPTSRMDARIRLLPAAPRGLKHWAPVHLHVGAAHLTARVALLDTEEVPPGGSALAQLVLDAPHCACHGDVFVLRNHSADHTIGGGRVLDPDAPSRRRRSKERLAMLAALESSEPRAVFEAFLASGPFGIDLMRFARSLNLSVDALALSGETVRRVKAAGVDIGFSPPHWSGLKQKFRDGLAAFHAKNPDELGPDAGRARRMWLPQVAAAACAALVDELAAEGSVSRSGPWLHLPTHSVSLSKGEQQLAERILPLVEEGRFDPLWVRDLARKAGSTEVQVRQLLVRLTRRGEVYQIVKDLFYSKRAVAELASLAAELERSDGEVRAAEFRDRTGLGRKRAIQILEFFDRVGYTRRVREAHRLRGDSLLQIAPRPPAQPGAGTGR